MKTRDRIISFILDSPDDSRSLLVRLIVGLIFLSEGIQKFLYPGSVGTGRFEEIGFTNPAFWAYFTASFEILCGTFILAGFLTRSASIPLLIIMITAFITTKWPLVVNDGFWSFAHAYRTDFAMTILLIYLLIYGGGKWSINKLIFKSV
jgi:putative oxidoreductase